MHHLQTVGGAALTVNEPSASGVSDAAADDHMESKGPHRRVIAILGVVALVIVIIDVVTKQLAVSRLEGRESVPILGGTIYLLVTRNSGAAFSFARGYTFIFPIVAIIVSGWIGWMAWRLRSMPWAVSLGLVLGGTIGNLLDRLFREPGPFMGRVVDFISLLDPNGQGFPVFNVADSALCVGVALAVLLELTGWRRDGTRASLAREGTDGR